MVAMAENHQWSQAWLETLHRLNLLGPRTATGSGNRIRRMEVALGQVTAEVQQRGNLLCQVTMHFAPLPDEAWQNVLSIFQQQLAGVRLIEPHLAFPESEPAFGALRALLLPERAQAIQATCSCCPDGQNLRNCAALQTVFRQLGAMLDEEPVLLLRLRGREWQQVIQTLQQRPAGEYGASSSAQGTPPVRFSQSEGNNGRESQNDQEELSQSLSNFWGSRKEMESFRHHIAVPTIDLAILRRLGPLPEELGDPQVDQQLAMLYRHISREAEALAYDLDRTPTTT